MSRSDQSGPPPQADPLLAPADLSLLQDELVGAQQRLSRLLQDSAHPLQERALALDLAQARDLVDSPGRRLADAQVPEGVAPPRPSRRGPRP